MTTGSPGTLVRIKKKSIYLNPNFRAIEPASEVGEEIFIASGPYAESLVKEGDVEYVESKAGVGIGETDSSAAVAVTRITEVGHTVTPAGQPPFGDIQQRRVLHQDDGTTRVVDDGPLSTAQIADELDKAQQREEKLTGGKKASDPRTLRQEAAQRTERNQEIRAKADEEAEKEAPKAQALKELKDTVKKL